MRLAMLLSVLLLTACTLREGDVSRSDDANDGLSLAAPGAAAPADADSGTCGDLIWRGSLHHDYIDGSDGRFCQ
jgi:hypothetical protein